VATVIENLQGAALRQRWYCRIVLNDSHSQSTRPPDPPPLALELLDAGPGCLRALVAGEIDFANALELQSRISTACVERGAPALVLDLVGVEFMDSSGLRAILHLQRELAGARGGLVLLGPTPQVRGILTLTGLDRQLPVADTLEQARTLLSDGPAARAPWPTATPRP
jgi:stage II sporulation protein AA (anti-sigma F factor antagonist)